MKAKKKSTEAERKERAVERQTTLTSVPEIWDQLSDLYNYYDERKEDPEARKMIALIEHSMAMTHDNPEYYTQFDTLHELALLAARKLFKKDPGLKTKYLLDPEDIAHETILHILERPADYNPNHPGRASFVARQVKFEMLTILREEANDRDAKRWLAEFLAEDPASISDMDSMKIYAAYFKEMVRLNKANRDLKKLREKGELPSPPAVSVKLSPEQEKDLIARIDRKKASREKVASAKEPKTKKTERKRA